jgi:hypothetical protein
MSTLDRLRTFYGDLAATIAVTYHVNWSGYREDGLLNLEQVFEFAYGRPMEMLEGGNDTSYSWDVRKQEIDSYNREQMDIYIKRGGFPHYYLNWFLYDLCNRDVIPPGRYVVRDSW